MKDLYLIVLLACAAFVLFFTSIDFNGIFVDEEFYINVGKYTLWKENWVGNPVVTMFGYHLFVPVIIALAESAGGLLFSRLVSSLFVTGTLAVIFLTTKKFFGSQRVSVISFLMGMSFVPLFFIGRLAMLDAASIFFAALSVFFMVGGTSEKSAPKSRKFILASSVLIFVSFLAKYIALVIFLPMLFFICMKKRRDALHFLLPCAVLVAVYVAAYFSLLAELGATKIVYESYIADNAISMAMILAPYVVLGLASKKKESHLLLPVVLAVVLFQFFIGDTINTLKHMTYAFIFIAPFAAAGIYNVFSDVSKNMRGKANYITLVKAIFISVAVFVIIINFAQINSFLEGFYIDERESSAVLDGIVEKGDIVLAESPAYRYYSKKLNFSEIATNFWFDYDNDRDTDTDDFLLAIRNGTFKAILATQNFIPSTDFSVLAEEGPYELYYEENHTLPYRGVVPVRIYLRS